MDYFGMSDIPSHLSTFVVLLDMAGNAAAVPGNGESRITVTHTCDVGRFVAASIDLEKWERVSTVIGDQMTMNEAVALAEEVKGEFLERRPRDVMARFTDLVVRDEI